MTLFAWILSAFYFFNATQIANVQFSKDAAAFFDQYVSDEGVNYTAIKKEATSLNHLVQSIANIDFEQLKDDTKTSFLLNSYNILVIQSVVDNFPIEGPLKVDGFFDKNTFKIGKQELSLNDLENIYLREQLGDPRIHFALVCAGKGCPPLTKVAFTPTNTDARLEALTIKALNHPKFIRIDKQAKKAEISQIFEWFAGDFGANQSEIIDFINNYRTKAIPKDYEIGYYEYDWDLNGF